MCIRDSVYAARAAGTPDQVTLDRLAIDAIELAVDVGLNGGGGFGAVHSAPPPPRFWRRNASRSSVWPPAASAFSATFSRVVALVAGWASVAGMMPCSTA